VPNVSISIPAAAEPIARSIVSVGLIIGVVVPVIVVHDTP
jgi:hypothetical protein